MIGPDRFRCRLVKKLALKIVHLLDQVGMIGGVDESRARGRRGDLSNEGLNVQLSGLMKMHDRTGDDERNARNPPGCGLPAFRFQGFLPRFTGRSPVSVWCNSNHCPVACKFVGGSRGITAFVSFENTEETPFELTAVVV